MRTTSALATVETLSKPASPQIDEIIRTLLDLIERVSSGVNQPFACGNAEEVLVDTQVDGSRYLLVRMPAPSRNRIQLSPREQEIVRMVAKGHPNKVIADVLNISSWTVCTHLRRIFAKLGVGSRAAMVAQLVEIGALPQNQRIATEIPSRSAKERTAYAAQDILPRA